MYLSYICKYIDIKIFQSSYIEELNSDCSPCFSHSKIKSVLLLSENYSTIVLYPSSLFYF